MANSGPDNSKESAVNAGAASDSTDAQIIEELDRMRARIQELESRLKDRPSGVVAKVSVQPPSSARNPLESSSISPLQTVDGRKGSSDSETETAKDPKAEPFAFADWTWLTGNPRTREAAFDSKFFTPEIRADVEYTYDFNHPKDDTIGGSSEIFRSNEIGLTQLGVGGDFHYDHVRARLMTQFGMYSETTPRNDASYSRGQWNLADAYRYVSEAYGGYHFDALHGINVDGGIFMSYVGLFSYYNLDNWSYQPSYVSSNTPWFFTGMRIQVFPTAKLKIEPWIINGWQSYARPTDDWAWAVKFYGVRHHGFRSFPTTTASEPMPSASPPARGCTLTTVLKSSTTIIRSDSSTNSPFVSREMPAVKPAEA